MIDNRLITLNDFASVRVYIDSEVKGSGNILRDYFFHRNGAKGGSGLKGVLMYELLQAAEICLEYQKSLANAS